MEGFEGCGKKEQGEHHRIRKEEKLRNADSQKKCLGSWSHERDEKGTTKDRKKVQVG